MKLLPRTLFGQLLLALCGGLIVVQAAGAWLMLNDRATFGEGLLGAFAAQRVAGVLAVLDKADPAHRASLVHALNVPPIHANLDETWQTSREANAEDARIFIERIEHELEHPLPIQILSIKRLELHRRDRPQDSNGGAAGTAASAAASTAADTPAAQDAESRPNRRPHQNRPPVLFVVGQARLSDGAIVTFRHSLPDPQQDWPLRLLILLSMLGLSVALLAAWAVRRLTHPLAALADAAGGLARNLEREPLPENGPKEVSQAARAFNAMQRDLKRYLETRAQALAGVSHDLRLPITRLRLRIERIEDEELKSKMENDLAEMDDMIGNTLAFLRAGSNAEKLSQLDLNALLESVVEDMLTLGAKVELHGHALRPIPARPQALRRCLGNLLDNARRYGEGNIEISILDQPAAVEIRIEDRGPGIPDSELERVFEPYVRVETSRAKHTGGSGLGLAIARATARSHGGDVKLETRAGGGICAILRLPRNVLSTENT